jgi:hypothetical protein
LSRPVALKAKTVLKAIPQVVERYVHGLHQTLNRNPTQARSILAALLGFVVWHPEMEILWAELRADLRILLDEHVVQMVPGGGFCLGEKPKYGWPRILGG